MAFCILNSVFYLFIIILNSTPKIKLFLRKIPLHGVLFG